MATRKTFCGSPDHGLSRRGFLGAAGTFAAMTGLDALQSPAVAAEMKAKGKRVILLWLAGGASRAASRSRSKCPNSTTASRPRAATRATARISRAGPIR